MADWFSNIPLVQLLRGEPAPGEQPRPTGQIPLADFNETGKRIYPKAAPDYGELSAADAELAAGGPSIDGERLGRAINKAYGDTARNKRLREVAKWSAAQDKERRAKEREQRHQAAAAKHQAQRAALAQPHGVPIAARRWQDEPACFRFDDDEPTLWVVYLRAEGPDLVVYINNVDRPSQWIEVARQGGCMGWGARQTINWQTTIFSGNWLSQQSWWHGWQSDFDEVFAYFSPIPRIWYGPTRPQGTMWNAAGHWSDKHQYYSVYERWSEAYCPRDCGPILPPGIEPGAFMDSYAMFTSGSMIDVIDGYHDEFDDPDPSWACTAAQKARHLRSPYPETYSPWSNKPYEWGSTGTFPFRTYERRIVMDAGCNGLGAVIRDIPNDTAYLSTGNIRPWGFFNGYACQRQCKWYVHWNSAISPSTRPWFRTSTDNGGGEDYNEAARFARCGVPKRYYRMDEDRTVVNPWAPKRKGKPYEPTVDWWAQNYAYYADPHIAGLHLVIRGGGWDGNGDLFYGYGYGVWQQAQFNRMGHDLTIRYYVDTTNNRPEVNARLVSLLGWPNKEGYTERHIQTGHPDWNWSSGEFTVLGLAFM